MTHINEEIGLMITELFKASGWSDEEITDWLAAGMPDNHSDRDASTALAYLSGLITATCTIYDLSTERLFELLLSAKQT